MREDVGVMGWGIRLRGDVVMERRGFVVVIGLSIFDRCENEVIFDGGSFLSFGEKMSERVVF